MNTFDAVLENFRRLPVAVRKDLLKQLIDVVDLPVETAAAEAKTNGTSKDEIIEEDFKLPMTPRFVRRTASSKDRAKEFAWLAQHRDEYAGQWVALEGEQLIAHDPAYSQVSQAVEAAGIRDALVLFVEGQDTLHFTGL